MPIASTVFPESRQALGVGREATSGTVVAPAITVPVAKMEPDEKVTYLDDKSIRGYMAVDYGLIQGVECAEFSLNGPVYMDTIGYFLHNIMGDYTSSGTSPSSATTVSSATSVGATSVTVAAIGSIVMGSVLQFGNATISTAPTETLTVASVAGSVVTFSTPCRFAHSATAAIAIVSAPFTHIFALLNSGNGQPVTHTLTHYSGPPATYGARQYAYWCGSEVEFTMNSEELFMQSTKGTSFLGALASSAPANIVSNAPAQPNWQFKVGIGGAASGGTLVSNVINGGVTIQRAIKPWFTLQGAQAPYVIARNGLEITGKFTQLAQDESPMLDMLNNVQPQLQMTMTNGLSGAYLLSVTFDFKVGAYETSKLNGTDEIQYDVTWRAIANSTNVGASAGLAPGVVTVVNAIPSY